MPTDPSPFDLIADAASPVHTRSGIGPRDGSAGRRSQPQDRKILLRATAARLLDGKPNGAFSLASVSMAAGWSPRFAASYYRDADDLLADTLFEHLVALNAAVCAAFDATAAAPPAERLTGLALAFLGTALDQRNEHLALRRNTLLVSEARRGAVVGRSRQVIATLREALFACVPGLDTQPALGGLLARQLAGALSEATTWFREDNRIDRSGLAQLLAAQALVVARAAVDGSWVMPAPVAHPASPAALLPAGEPDDSPDPPPCAPPGEIWLTSEQARRSLPRLVRAVQAGTEVVVTRRGLPAAKLVAATQEHDRLRRMVGGRAELAVLSGRGGQRAMAADVPPASPARRSGV